jgi:DNA-binding transcriptional LysR family regulator
VHGSAHISASEVMGVKVLPPMLAALQAQHPELRVELVTSNALQDLVRREVDIAVRMSPPQQDVLLATRVGDVELGLHAHRSYLERHGQPASVAELANHVLIGFDRETPFLRSATTKLPIWQRDNFHWRCDSDLALLRAGAGIGVCQTALARRDPNLVRVLHTRLALKLTNWVPMHEGLRNSPRCRVVFDGLVKGLRGYVK